MEEMVRILMEHRANFSVEFYVDVAKVRVRKTQAWTEDHVWRSSVFRELKLHGYNHHEITMLRGTATPTAVVEYHFDR